MSKRTTAAYSVAAIGAILGLLYSGISTSDFANHLDRKIHPVTCSLLPGLADSSTALAQDSGGCKTALMSPYSSFMRDRFWGGIPWSLPAMGLFGFGLAVCAWSFVTRRGHEFAPSSFLLLAAVTAALSSAVFFYLSAARLGIVCTTCVGSYLGSALMLLGAGLVVQFARADRWVNPADSKRGGTLFMYLWLHAVELVLAVTVPVLAWAGGVPDYSEVVGTCGRLKHAHDRPRVTLDIGGPGDGPDALLVMDPLCGACKAFLDRLGSVPGTDAFHYRLLLMPLDSECNWMLNEDSMHPGSCLLSRALLCSGNKTADLLDFIHGNQERLRMLGIGGKLDEIRKSITARFPGIEECMDLPDTKVRLNKALRFAVRNTMPVATPQLYLDGVKLCDEDTDLGLEYALSRLGNGGDQ